MLTYRQLGEIVGDEYQLVLDSQEIEDTLELLGVTRHNRKNATGLMVIVGEGDYDSVWVCTDSKPYNNNSYYEPLPVFTKNRFSKDSAWSEDNPEYN